MSDSKITNDIKVAVLDGEGKSVDELSLPEEIFAVKPKSGVLHSVIKAYKASRRQGTHATKNRSLVSGSSKKPFKQKGTGNARQGSIRAVQLYHGAVAHGPQPRSYRQSLNKKLKVLALKMSLTDRLNHKKIIVLEDKTLDFSSYSTGRANGLLSKLTKYHNTLIVDCADNDILARSVQNLYRVDYNNPYLINAEHILSRHYIVFSTASMAMLISRLS